MGKTASNASAPKKETNRRKVVFRDEAMGAAALLGDDITFDNAWVIYKLDCFDCTLHDVHNPKSVNCRDNPYCIKRLGLEKFEKLIKAEKANSAKVEEEQRRRDVMEIPCGLTNSGNFCYVNSFLQVWYNEPVFRQIIFDWRPSADYIKPQPPAMDVEAVMNSLQQLFYTLQTTPFEDTDDNKHFTEALRLGNEQQDAQEFSLVLFDALDRNLQKHPNGENIRRRIRECYSGITSQRIWCKCGKESKHSSPCSALQLNIDGHKTLQDALNAYFGEEVLEDYRCDVCNEQGKVKRQTISEKLPPVLMLQLNRYVFDASGRNRKLKSPISYPRDLSARSLQPSLSPEEGWDYELFAVMIHEGDNTYCGHYYDLVKHPATGKWFKYNDESVELLVKPPGTERGRNVAVSRPPPDMKACYGLVYRKKIVPMPDIVPPPSSITDPWDKVTENRFAGQTKETIAKSELRLNEITSRYASLQSMFDCLQTHADKFKKLRDVAFLPTSLLSEILLKEYEIATPPVEENDKIGKDKSLDESMESNSSQSTVESANDSVPVIVKRKRGRPSVLKAARIQVAQLLGKHEMPICSHGKLFIDTVLFGDVKAVSRVAAETLLARYGMSTIARYNDGSEEKRPMLTGSDVCIDCVKELRREAHFKDRLETDVKLANKIYREAKTRCSLAQTDKPTDYYYVSKKCLANFKKLAVREMEHHHKLQSAGTTLTFAANPEIILSMPSTAFSSIGVGDSPKRFRPIPVRRKRLLMDEVENGCNGELPLKQTKDEETVEKRIVNAVSDAVEEMVASVSDEHRDESPLEPLPLTSGGSELGTVILEDRANGTRIGDKCDSDGSEQRSSNTPLDRPSSSNSAATSHEGGAVEFNAELRCPHGGVNLDEFRHAVSPDEWRQLSEYFTTTFEVRCSDPVCQECARLEREAHNGKMELKETLKDLKGRFGDMLRDIDRRKPKDADYGTLYTRGICSTFLANLSSAIKSRGASHDVPTICQVCVMCRHGYPGVGLSSKEIGNRGSQIVPLTENEWQRITEEWGGISATSQDYPVPIIIGKQGVIEDICEKCFGEHIEAINMQQYVYENAPVFVLLQNEDSTNSSVAVQKTTRRTQKRNCFKIKMSSSDTVMDLKRRLYKETGQSPNDQLLYRELGGSLLDNKCTMFEARIQAHNSEQPLILISQTFVPNTLKYDDQRAPERGFIDTALAH